MYSIEELKDLIAALDKSGLTEISIKNENGAEIQLKKKIKTEKSASQVSAAQTVQYDVIPTAKEELLYDETANDELDIISSPMVGVFYESPSPNSKPFVSVGQSVSKGDTVCIIEAMKLMNEITAEKNGVIAEVCVNNGDIVEYGQPLFKIR